MVGILVRGRLAWIFAIVTGLGVGAYGIATSTTWGIITGAGFLLFGVVFLILSLVTKGQTD